MSAAFAGVALLIAGAVTALVVRAVQLWTRRQKPLTRRDKALLRAFRSDLSQDVLVDVLLNENGRWKTP